MGLKKDLRTDPVEIQRLEENKQKPTRVEDGEKMAERIGAVGYYECSAKEKVKYCFHVLQATAHS